MLNFPPIFRQNKSNIQACLPLERTRLIHCIQAAKRAASAPLERPVRAATADRSTLELGNKLCRSLTSVFDEPFADCNSSKWV